MNEWKIMTWILRCPMQKRKDMQLVDSYVKKFGEFCDPLTEGHPKLTPFYTHTLYINSNSFLTYYQLSTIIFILSFSFIFNSSPPPLINSLISSNNYNFMDSSLFQIYWTIILTPTNNSTWLIMSKTSCINDFVFCI